MAEQLDAQDAELVGLVRAAMARADADSGAAVRDLSPTAVVIVTDRAGNPL